MIFRRQDHEQLEKQLAPYATRASQSRGRENPIEPDVLRTDFQRDRDRIIHCAAFRRLEFKTQVHVISGSDYHRTRITHTMEVAQIGRTLSRALNVNPDLVEAICLAHDLGHTPFGHSGEYAMKECMKEHGGFEHNEQGLRVVEVLEERYSDHPGLNLTWEVREGIIKHDTTYDKPASNPRFNPDLRPSLESQVVDFSDEIAYNCADLDDALRLGYIDVMDLQEIPWVFKLFEKAHQETGAQMRHKFCRFRVLGYIYDMQVDDLLGETSKRIDESGVASPEEVREYDRRLVDFTEPFKPQIKELKDFLMERVYQHPVTVTHSERGKMFVHNLFDAYLNTPRLLPVKHQKRIDQENIYRVVCDYISGMTDRFAHEQCRSLFHPEVVK